MLLGWKRILQVDEVGRKLKTVNSQYLIVEGTKQYLLVTLPHPSIYQAHSEDFNTVMLLKSYQLPGDRVRRNYTMGTLNGLLIFVIKKQRDPLRPTTGTGLIIV